LYETFSIKLQYSVFFVQVVVHCLFFYFLYKLAVFKKANIIDVLFLFTPFCLWGLFSDVAIGARKDGVLWLLFAAYVYLLSQNRLTRKKEYFFLVLFVISVFIHESYIFYAQYFVIARYFYDQKIDIKKYGFILLSFYVPASILFMFGNINLDYHNTLQLIKECNIELQAENIFRWKEKQLIKTDYYREEYKPISLYAASFAFQICFVLYYMYLKKFTAETRKKLLLAFGLALFITTPLFLIAIDVGRWFYNSFVLFSLLLLSLIPVGTRDMFFDIKFLKDYRTLIFIILVLIADFSYRVPSAFVGIQPGLPLRFFLHFF